jgi:hypothetical protein
MKLSNALVSVETTLGDESVLSTDDVRRYLEGDGIDFSKFVSTVRKLRIPIPPVVGKVRMWEVDHGWYLKKMEDCEELRRKLSISHRNDVLVFWEKKFESYTCKPFFSKYIYGRNRVYENKRKYMVYNIDVLCRRFSGIKRLAYEGKFN